MTNLRQILIDSFIAILACSFLVFDASGPVANTAQAQDDWNQWGGPERNFSASALAGDKPLPKPILSWKRKLGKGHAAIVTSGEFGYSVHLDGDDEVVEKWRLDNGQRVWNYRYKVGYHASPQYDGPHATPAVQSDRIIVASINAQIHAIDTSSGKMIWRRDLRADFGTKLPQSGYACSPLILQDRVIFQTLGEAQAAETENYASNPKIPKGRKAIPGAIALNIRTGENVWQSETFRSSHASPIKIEIDKQPMLVFHGMFELVGVDPSKGTILWNHLLRREAADNVSFTPIWDSKRSQLLISHGYCDFGTQAIKLEKNRGKWRTSVNWTNSRLQIVHTNAVLLNNTLVGTKRPSATLMVAIDVRDGRTIFRRRGFGKSNLLTVGSQLLILEENGDLVCGQLNDDEVTETWKLSVLSNNAWTVLTMAGRRLLLRDDRELKVYRFP